MPTTSWKQQETSEIRSPVQQTLPQSHDDKGWCEVQKGQSSYYHEHEKNFCCLYSQQRPDLICVQGCQRQKDSLQWSDISLGDKKQHCFAAILKWEGSRAQVQEPLLCSRAGWGDGPTWAEVTCAATLRYRAGASVHKESAPDVSFQTPSRTAYGGRTLSTALFINFFFIFKQKCVFNFPRRVT